MTHAMTHLAAEIGLGFFIPAPRAAGLSILDLPQDDFCMETKRDGIRVVVLDGQVWNRHGLLVTKPKGADRVLAACSTLPPGIALEGEWENKIGMLWAFDVPLHSGTYDERVADLIDLIPHLGPKDGTNVGLIHRCVDCSFREFYNGLKETGGSEGVVVKRRNKMYERCSRPGMESAWWMKRRFRNDR